MAKKETKIFSVPGTIVRTNPMKDGGMSLGFYTQELSSKEKVQLIDYLHAFGWILFKENEFSDSDIPKEAAELDDLKSPSKRLRAVIYRFWEQMGKEGDFNQFYSKKMEYIINQFKEKLEH